MRPRPRPRTRLLGPRPRSRTSKLSSRILENEDLSTRTPTLIGSDRQFLRIAVYSVFFRKKIELHRKTLFRFISNLMSDKLPTYLFTYLLIHHRSCRNPNENVTITSHCLEGLVQYFRYVTIACVRACLNIVHQTTQVNLCQ